MPPQTVLLRTELTRTIIIYRLVKRKKEANFAASSPCTILYGSDNTKHRKGFIVNIFRDMLYM